MLSLYLFGAPRLEIDQQPRHLDRRKALALLIYLAVTGRSHTRDYLATLLFEDHSAAEGRGALRRIFSTLNVTLGEHWFEADRERLALRPGVWIDVCQFEHGIAAGELEKAVALYTGEFLAGFTLPDSPAFEEWQLFYAQHLRQQYSGALEHLIQRYRAQPDRALRYARDWLALDPLHEEAHRALMRLYAAAGQRRAALQQYQDCVRLLQRELQAAPSPETTALFEQLARQGDTLLEPGQPTILPDQPVTPLLGREPELALIQARLRDPACRLLTIIGAGGIGKTRLALQTAALAQAYFPQGSRVIYLAAVQDGDRLVQAISDGLGLDDYACGKASEQLIAYLSGRALLLVLDNFEHLTAQAGVIADLLAKTTQIKVLVTSRERLRLQGEWLIELQGLPQDSAAMLFGQVAQRLNVPVQDWAGVARICDLVEGMPLGIELAAAWVRLLSPSEIAQEIERSAHFLQAPLQDIPARHRSLEAVFEHSWHLLTGEERALLMQLSVFRGGFHREAAQQVAGASLPLLLSLVDKSLLRSNGRFDLHELIRQYAARKLAADPALAAAVAERHAHYYLEYVRRETEAFVDDAAIVNREAAEEIVNIRVALQWLVDHRHLAWIAAYSKSLHRFYCGVGSLQEGEKHMARLAALLPPSVPLAYILMYQSKLSAFLGLHVKSKTLLEQSLAMFREAQDEHGIVLALIQGGSNSFNLGDYALAESQLREALAISQTNHFDFGISKALNFLGYTLAQVGELETSKAMLEESLRLARQVTSRHNLASALNSLGYILILRGDYAYAETMLHEAIEARYEMRDHYGAIVSVLNLGHLYVALDQATLARHYFIKVLRVCLESHSLPTALDALGGLAILEARDEKWQRAAEINALVQQNPATWMETRRRGDDLWTVLQARLPSDLLAHAETCGRLLKWDEVARDLISAAG